MKTAFDSYIICGTPRTGSTLLCNLLAGTGIAGDPDSFFMSDPGPVWIRQWGLPSRDGLNEADYCTAYLRAAIRYGHGHTGVFGLRLMRENLGDLLAMIDMVYPGLPSDRDRLQAAFGRVLCIHLTRDDKLAQAVSMVKAEQTGLWHIAPNGSELERLSPPQPPEYDFNRIRMTLEKLHHYDAAWLAWFSEQGIRPLRIRYDLLSEKPADAVALILDRLGLDTHTAKNPAPGVAKLADAGSLEWIARYRAEAGR